VGVDDHGAQSAACRPPRTSEEPAARPRPARRAEARGFAPLPR
jgi:hypothetical protein